MDDGLLRSWRIFGLCIHTGTMWTARRPRTPAQAEDKHLSRGMRMKTALASVLAFGPELLLMDEPFTGLDPAVRTELIQTLLDRIHTEDPANATTIVISSHDLDEVESFATHVGFLHGGRLLFAQPIESLLTRCREVTVTFENEVAANVSAKLPEGCVAAEASGAMLRFVDLRVNVRGPRRRDSRSHAGRSACAV